MVVSAILRKVRPISAHDDLATAFRAIVASGGRHVPVVDDDEALVGVVSEWDLLRAWQRPDAKTLTVRKAMTGNVHTTHPNESLLVVAQRLLDERIGCLPVLDGDTLLGVVTVTDVVAAVARDHFGARKKSPARAAKPRAKKAKARR